MRGQHWGNVDTIKRKTMRQLKSLMKDVLSIENEDRISALQQTESILKGIKSIYKKL